MKTQADLEHEFGCIKEIVGLPIQLHRLQGFILLQKMQRIFGEKRFDLLHVVGPGEFHCFVPLREEKTTFIHNYHIIALACGFLNMAFVI